MNEEITETHGFSINLDGWIEDNFGENLTPYMTVEEYSKIQAKLRAFPPAGMIHRWWSMTQEDRDIWIEVDQADHLFYDNQESAFNDEIQFAVAEAHASTGIDLISEFKYNIYVHLSTQDESEHDDLDNPAPSAPCWNIHAVY